MPSAPTQDFLTAHASVLVFFLFMVGFLALNLVLWWILRPSRFSEEKLTTYECGENPEGTAWIQFNIRFYVFALIFVVFDVETVFLLPWAVVYKDIGLLALTQGPGLIGSLLVGLAFAKGLALARRMPLAAQR